MFCASLVTTVQITRKFNASCESLARARQALTSTRFPLASARKLHAWVLLCVRVGCMFRGQKFSGTAASSSTRVRVQSEKQAGKSSGVRLVYE